MSRTGHKGAKGVRGERGSEAWEDLAPDICRQRMVLEGTLYNTFEPTDMVVYCNDVSKVLDMTPVAPPELSFAKEYGWCCFMHWKESGMHIYGWDNRNPKFFSIDIYTCKSFDPYHVLAFSREFLGENLIKLTWRD